MADQSDQTETKRDRVRRLFVQPMTDLGWRKPGNVKVEAHAELLDKLCDHLAYLDDEGFARLRQGLRGKGDGKTRDAWPPMARIIAYAEMVTPRPIDELPALMRWFRSEAGARADQAGRLVEEYQFWNRHKRPPVHPQDQRNVAEAADRNARRGDLITDRARREVAVDPADHVWLRSYQDQLYRLRAIVNGEDGE